MAMERIMGTLLAGVGLVGAATGAVEGVTALTTGPGNDTEAVWSPDGKTIAFQTDRNGDLDIAQIPAEGGELTWLVRGPGESAYPAWSPDGTALVYSHGGPMGTAFATRDAREGFNLRILQNGRERALTTGHVRDYVPTVSPDGKFVWFTTTRASGENGAGLARVSWEGGEPTMRLPQTQPSHGAVQPSLSPDGKYLLWAGLQGIFSNWRVCVARPERPEVVLFLTPQEMSAYAPRWSPCGRFVACTGYRVDDPGWGVYVIRVADGALRRLDLGPGSSKSPAWSPDGARLVFENNRTGCYKLYTATVPTNLFPQTLQTTDVAPREPYRHVARLSADGTELHLVEGEVQGRAVGTTGHVFELPSDNGMSPGTGTFFVEATVQLEKTPDEFDYIAVGSFAEAELGFQLFFNKQRQLTFATRNGTGNYFFGTLVDSPKPGRTFRVTGVRERGGILSLYLDGRCRMRVADSSLSLKQLQRISIGCWGGKAFSGGRVLDFQCGMGFPPGCRPMPTSFSEL